MRLNYIIIPLITIIGLQLPALLGGAAIVIALFWIVFSGRRGPTPPARRS